MKQKYILPLILVIDFALLILKSTTLSISYLEAHIFYGYHGISGFISNIFTSFLPQNDTTLRLPFILLHIVSAYLLYKISDFYLKSYRIKLY